MKTEDYSNAIAARDAGMALSAEKAGSEWRANAMEHVRKYLETHKTLTSDSLWASGLPHSKSDRGLGSVISAAYGLGWIDYIYVDGVPNAVACVKSVRRRMALGPVWRSLIYKGSN